jgi:hypothetical protein
MKKRKSSFCTLPLNTFAAAPSHHPVPYLIPPPTPTPALTPNSPNPNLSHSPAGGGPPSPPAHLPGVPSAATIPPRGPPCELRGRPLPAGHSPQRCGSGRGSSGAARVSAPPFSLRCRRRERRRFLTKEVEKRRFLVEEETVAAGSARVRSAWHHQTAPGPTAARCPHALCHHYTVDNGQVKHDLAFSPCRCICFSSVGWVHWWIDLACL